MMSGYLVLTLFSILSAFFTAVFIGIKYFTDIKDKATKYFFLGFITHLFIFLFRIPFSWSNDFLRYNTSNALGALAIIFFSIAMSHFLEKKPRYFFLYSLLFIQITLLSWFTQGYNHAGARILIYAIIESAIFAVLLLDTWRYYIPAQKSIKKLILTILSLWMLAHVMRAIVATIQFNELETIPEPERISPFLSGSFIFISIIGASAGLLVYSILIDRATLKEKQTSNRLAQVIKEKDEIYATVAHELQAPLNSTMHSIEILKNSNEDTKSPQQVTEEVERSLQELRTLLEGLLDWASRHINQETKIAKAIPGVEIRDLIFSLKNNTQDSRIKINSKIHEELNNSMAIDADLLRIVTKALIDNAIRHGAENSEIFLSAALKNNYLHLVVKNNISEKSKSTDGRQIGLKLLKSHIEQAGGKLSTKRIGKAYASHLQLPVS